MSQVTLEAIQAKQTELAAMIQQLQTQAIRVFRIETDGRILELQHGEHYAGAVLNEDGQHVAHLVLMAARPDTKLNWQDAMEWAKSTGGDLPDRQEQALLFANCRPHLKPDWHWSCKTYEDDASYSWGCYFPDGFQSNGLLKSGEGCAVAVRLIPLTA